MTPRRPGAAVLVRNFVRTPFALTFVTALFATTIWARQHPVGAAAAMRWVSTNVHNLSVAPIRSFVLSALFLPDGRLLLNAVLLLAAIIPLERRVGSLRALAVFASAHVLATALTEGWIWFAVRSGSLPVTAEFQDDVGVSYGLYSVAAAALYFVPRRFRAVAVGALAAYVLLPWFIQPEMTTTGHVLSLGIGLLWWLVLGRIAQRRALAAG